MPNCFLACQLLTNQRPGAGGGGVGEGVRLHRCWRDKTALDPLPPISAANLSLPQDPAGGCTSGHDLRARLAAPNVRHGQRKTTIVKHQTKCGRFLSDGRQT